MSRNLFEEAAELEQLAHRVEAWARAMSQSASDRDAETAEARDKQAERSDPQGVK